MTRIGAWINSQRDGPERADRSGFRLLANGRDAFVARVALIELAERTLDLQYYIFRADTTGAIIVDRLIAAADRGVKVRLLLDDWGTLEKNDAVVAGCDAHPGIEIRLFNPYRNRSGFQRLRELFRSFDRVNRRMHNKQLIADGAAAILGGRNIGNEYFELGDLHFQDVDVLTAGAAARESQASFDAYWNSPFAIPIGELGTFDTSRAAWTDIRRRLRERVEREHDSAYARALATSDLARAMRAEAVSLHWAEGHVLADPPGKVTMAPETPNDAYLGAQLTPHATNVKRELLVASAYFIPGPRGVDVFGGMRRDGVDVRILTNSLAATDVWLVHSAYRKYRRALLEQDVRIFELKPDAPGAHRKGVKGGVGSSRASLHAKTFVIDRSAVFIGSLNIDPRSLRQNTEVGVIVHSPELAGEVAELFDRWSGPELSYAVALKPHGGHTHLRWTGTQGGTAVELRDEPHAGFWRRLGAALFSVLPIESQI